MRKRSVIRNKDTGEAAWELPLIVDEMGRRCNPCMHEVIDADMLLCTEAIGSEKVFCCRIGDFRIIAQICDEENMSAR